MKVTTPSRAMPAPTPATGNAEYFDELHNFIHEPPPIAYQTFRNSLYTIR